MNRDAVQVGQVGHVAWSRVLPVLHLLKALNFAFRLRILIPATLLLFIGSFCVTVSDGLFLKTSPGSTLNQKMPASVHGTEEFSAGISVDLPEECAPGTAMIAKLALPVRVRNVIPQPLNLLVDRVWRQLLTAVPIRQLFPGSLLLAIVFALFATGVCRSVATQFCVHTRTGPYAAFRFSLSQWKATFVSLALATALVMIPLALLQSVAWLARTFTAFYFMTVIAWPIVLAVALTAVLTILIVGAGWLLSIASIATDQCTGSDALSRGISYVLSHKLLFTAYIVISAGLSWIARAVMAILVWNVDTALSSRMPQLFRRDTGSGLLPQWQTGWHATFLRLPDVVQLATFLAALTIVYILLRQKEDGIRLRDLDSAR